MHSISDTICVARRIILSFESSASILRKLILSFGSSPAVGSSRISIFGSLSKACANSSLCFIPPEKLPAFAFRTSYRLTFFSMSLISSLLCFMPLTVHIYFKYIYALKSLYSACCCGIYPIKSRYFAPKDTISLLLIKISPDVLFTLSVRRFIRVVLPEPFGPSMPYIPSFKVSVRSFTALLFPYIFVRFLISIFIAIFP